MMTSYIQWIFFSRNTASACVTFCTYEKRDILFLVVREPECVKSTVTGNCKVEVRFPTLFLLFHTFHYPSILLLATCRLSPFSDCFLSSIFHDFSFSFPYVPYLDILLEYSSPDFFLTLPHIRASASERDLVFSIFSCYCAWPCFLFPVFPAVLPASYHSLLSVHSSFPFSFP